MLEGETLCCRDHGSPKCRDACHSAYILYFCPPPHRICQLELPFYIFLNKTAGTNIEENKNPLLLKGLAEGDGEDH